MERLFKLTYSVALVVMIAMVAVGLVRAEAATTGKYNV
jgi:hypothetical protein